jgi:hypothetical protein
MRSAIAVLIPLVALATVAGGCGARAPAAAVSATSGPIVAAGTTYRWSFDGASAPTPGTGVVCASPARVFDAVVGDWGVEPDDDAVSAPATYRQTRAYGAFDEPRVLVRGLAFRDLDLSVRCRIDAGQDARDCGLVFGAVDADRYLVARADALLGVVRLVHQQPGDAREIDRGGAMVTPHVWHTLAVHVRGPRIAVEWDGQVVLSAADWSLPEGRIGLATTADATASFDDLAVTAD